MLGVNPYDEFKIEMTEQEIQEQQALWEIHATKTKEQVMEKLQRFNQLYFQYRHQVSVFRGKYTQAVLEQKRYKKAIPVMKINAKRFARSQEELEEKLYWIKYNARKHKNEVFENEWLFYSSLEFMKEYKEKAELYKKALNWYAVFE